MLIKCIQCEKEIEQKGNRKRLYCSDKCRVAFKRTNKIVQSEQKSYPNTNQSEQTQSEQVNPNKVIIQEGVCHGCQRRIVNIPEQWAEGTKWEEKVEMAKKICICIECVKKGITHEKLGLDINKCK